MEVLVESDQAKDREYSEIEMSTIDDLDLENLTLEVKYQYLQNQNLLLMEQLDDLKRRFFSQHKITAEASKESDQAKDKREEKGKKVAEGEAKEEISSKRRVKDKKYGEKKMDIELENQGLQVRCQCLQEENLQLNKWLDDLKRRFYKQVITVEASMESYSAKDRREEKRKKVAESIAKEEISSKRGEKDREYGERKMLENMKMKIKYDRLNEENLQLIKELNDLMRRFSQQNLEFENQCQGLRVVNLQLMKHLEDLKRRFSQQEITMEVSLVSDQAKDKKEEGKEVAENIAKEEISSKRGEKDREYSERKMILSAIKNFKLENMMLKSAYHRLQEENLRLIKQLNDLMRRFSRLNLEVENQYQCLREVNLQLMKRLEDLKRRFSEQNLEFKNQCQCLREVNLQLMKRMEDLKSRFSEQQAVSHEPEELNMLMDTKTEDEDEPLSVQRHTNMSSKQGGEVLTEIPEGDEWLALKICTTVCKPVLPESPNCPFLFALSLEGSKALMAIPSLFFGHMPALTCLNLSHTSIRSLPVSFFKLISLKELILRHCKLFMELSPQVGQLHDLVLLDLDETQIAELPKEIGKLFNLKILRVSLDGYMNFGMQLQQNVLIHPETIKSLSQLIELKIDVNPDNEDWNAVEEVVVEEACSLKNLKCLILYLPNVKILGKHRVGNSSLSYYPLCRFRFTVGQHRQRVISRVPKKVDAHFQEWDKCLKFVKGNDISTEMKRVVRYTKAFYLERHATARSLCDFGIKNIENLEFCILAECNEFETIIDDKKPYEEGQTDMVEDEVIDYESKGEAFSAREPVLLNLHYFYIYYLKNLVSIWRNPTYDKQCLSGLKILELHVCPKLSVIFSPALLTNLGKLEVLVVEDCPELTSVVSPTSNASIKSAPNCFLPSLKMMLLLFLPKLENISSEFPIAPKLEKVGFYDCPELKGLSKRELSSENLKVIKGESDWWEALKWDEAEWGKEFLEPFMESDESESESQGRNRPICLQNIFSPIDEDDDVMTQMEEMYESINPKNSNEILNPGNRI